MLFLKLRSIGWKITFTFFVFISFNHKYVVKKPDTKKDLEHPGLDGRIILRWIFWKWDGRGEDLLNWLRIGTVGGTCECGNEPSVYAKCGDFLE